MEKNLSENKIDQQTIQKLIDQLHAKYNQSEDSGKLASYIPELALVSPHHFSIAVTLADGQVLSVGDTDVQFTLQSTSKPFVYGLALNDHGTEFVHSKVGVEPSGEAFNSIIELEKKTHLPFNPMINSGAIAIANLIHTRNSIHPLNRMLDLFSDIIGHPVHINHQVFESEKKTAHRNMAIAHLLRHFDVIDDRIEETLDLYFKQCSVMMNVKDLSMMAGTLALSGVQPQTKKIIYSKENNRKILSLMLSCGMYDSAGTWTFTAGVPAKSGVSGAMFAAIPGRLGIAVHAPLINSQGHSVKGLKVIQDFCQELNLSVLG